MANQLRQQIEQISREKNINPDVIIAAIEDAILTASKKYYKSNEDLRSRFNNESGQIDVFIVKQIVETVEDPRERDRVDEARDHNADAEVGDEIHLPIPTDGLGRIAAQSAKQVLYQRVREAERENIYNEYIDRVGEVLNGTVKRFERGDIVVDLGRTEAVVPRTEQAAPRALQPGRAHPRRHRRGAQAAQGAADRAVAHRSPPARQAVRDRGAGDLRRHGG